ncbi:MAG: CBS domain-containing protein [Gammaproteobacteria bacterium]|nr:MAG: CBS domain-containing protein [Gammaproteobacteria bacterium]
MTLTSSENVRSLMVFLRQFAPFKQMDDASLALLVEKAALDFFVEGEAIIGPDQGVARQLYIVKQGLVRGERGEGDTTTTAFEIGPGECFPVAALIGERPTRTVHRAATDCFCLVVDYPVFARVFGMSAPFRDFCLRGVSSLLDQVNQHIQAEARTQMGAHQSLDVELSRLTGRSPVHCPPDMQTREAVRLMHANGIGSIIVTDPAERPIGIFTLHDLRRLVANDDSRLDLPLRDTMTPNPVTLRLEQTAFEAALQMAKHHFAHIVVVDDDQKLRGVVSERDLFSLQRVDLVHLARTIANAPNMDTLVALRSDVSRLCATMIAHGASAEQILHIITLLNDYTTRQTIRLMLQAHGDPGFPFTWLSFGSAARRAQTLYTDQDNGILFEAENEQDARDKQQVLLPLARHINEALDRCGFTLCKGNIMASNPDLCLSRQQWASWFMRFIDQATPQNLLNSSIFLDFRPIWGEEPPANDMFAEVRAHISQHTIFQKLLAANSLNTRPPLTVFRTFALQKRKDAPPGIDLKVQCLTPFTDGARVLALSENIDAVSTLHRFRKLAAKGAMDAQDAEAFEEAWSIIQMLRLRHQLACQQNNEPISNFILPDALNPLDRRILKEACRQAQRLQTKIERRYQL